MDERYVDFDELVDAIHFRMTMQGIVITKEQIIAVYDAESDYLLDIMEGEE